MSDRRVSRIRSRSGSGTCEGPALAARVAVAPVTALPLRITLVDMVVLAAFKSIEGPRAFTIGGTGSRLHRVGFASLDCLGKSDGRDGESKNREEEKGLGEHYRRFI